MMSPPFQACTGVPEAVPVVVLGDGKGWYLAESACYRIVPLTGSAGHIIVHMTRHIGQAIDRGSSSY